MREIKLRGIILKLNKIDLGSRGVVILIDYVDANIDETKLIFSMRNDIKIRECMHNQDETSWKNHLIFMRDLASRKDRQYFLVKQDNYYIGSIYFTNLDNKNKVAYFGLYANQFEGIYGVGDILCTTCISYAFDVLGLRKLKLEVFAKNIKARKLYARMKFKEFVENNNGIVGMELTNDRYNT